MCYVRTTKVTICKNNVFDENGKGHWVTKELNDAQLPQLISKDTPTIAAILEGDTDDIEL